MDVLKLFASIILLLTCKVHVAFSNCTQLTEASGTINNAGFSKRYSKCWRIIVPPSDYVKLDMESFVSPRDCPYSKVEISIGNRDYLHIFCPGQFRNWSPVMAFEDVTITHKIYSVSSFPSKFSMKYRRENRLCGQKDSFRCDDGVCISHSQVCDGIKQCHDGLDEIGCDVGFSNCTQLTEDFGTINNVKSSKRYSKCWRIIVPSSDYVKLEMESFVSPRGCPYSKVEISIGNRDHIFCPGQFRNWSPVTAYEDVTITHEIDSFISFFSMFSMKYRRENRLCGDKNSFRCDDGVCVSQSQVCDGIKQCYDGLDEVGCETGVFAVPGVNESRLNGTRWLKEKWSTSSGWQENTHRAIIALHLATNRNATGIDSEESLMVKQLEVQTLASILRNETDPLTVNQLSMFVNAMIVSCQDPRNFYEFDLLKLLKEKAKSSSLAAQSVAYLALCNAGETLPVNATGDLRNVLNSDSEYPFLLEVQAVAVMALSCIRANRQDGYNSSFIDTDYHQAVKKLEQLQFQDGSFGNIYTTAIVTQALLSAGEENSKYWNLQESVNHLMKYLNSSFGDFLATYLILPVLNGKSLSDIRNINCSDGLQQKPKGGLVPDVKKLIPTMRVRYTLYIGDDRDIVHTISLQTPENITVFDIMQLAEKEDSKCKFQWKKMGQKVYIYEIAGIKNDFEDSLFWLLYVRINDILGIHVKRSPDKVVVHNGEQIIMWYRKV